MVLQCGTPGDERQQQSGRDTAFSKRCADATTTLAKPGGFKRLVTEDPDLFVRYANGWRTIYNVVRDPGPIRPKPVVYWLWGDTGVGKSRAVALRWPGDQCYWKACDNKWWDGYEWNEAVCLDDFRGHCFRFEWLLALFEQNPLRIEKKGDSVNFNSKIIIVTTPTPPEGSFAHDENMAQLMRRLHKVIEVKADVEVDWT